MRGFGCVLFRKCANPFQHGSRRNLEKFRVGSANLESVENKLHRPRPTIRELSELELFLIEGAHGKYEREWWYLKFLNDASGGGIGFADVNFAKADRLPSNLRLCRRGEWSSRMLVEAILSMLTLVCHIKKVTHRRWSCLKTRVGFKMAGSSGLSVGMKLAAGRRVCPTSSN